VKATINKTKSEQGFSLLELMVSVVIFLIGVSAIYGVLRISMIQRTTIDTRTDQFRSARIALEYIRRDALNAGFGFHRTGGNVGDNAIASLLGINSDADTQRDILTSIIAGNQRNANVLNPTSGARTDSVSFVNRDTTFNGGNLVTFSGVSVSGSDVELITAPDANLNCRTYDLYLLESSAGTSQAVGIVSSLPSNDRIKFSTGDPLNLNQSAAASGEAQSLLVGFTSGGTAKKINITNYSVTNEGVLVRRRFGNQTGLGAANQIETRELVFGVSDLQVLYYMEDGTIVDDPSLNNNGRTNQLKMNNVVQIQLTITIAPSRNDGLNQNTVPIVLREYISTKNLRYEAN
jgi:prepilin-type N-terminal cleavage/methylation domain-containing protein